MELHKALRSIIKTDGPEILRNIRLVNILDDFNAYNDIPASKYILRAIISDGYADNLLHLGKWDNQAQAIINKFCVTTGFKEEAVWNIFQSVAFGLEWILIYNPIQSKISNNTNYVAPKVIPNSDFSCMTRAQQESYITGLIEVDGNIESKLGITISANATIKAPTLYLNVEASGKLEQDYSISVFAAVYNREIQMKGLRKIMIFNNQPILSSICCSSVFFDGFLKNRNYSEKCYECNISKIRLYAERDLY